MQIGSCLNFQELHTFQIIFHKSTLHFHPNLNSKTMSSNETTPIDPYTYLGLTKHQDGSITRQLNLLPTSSPSSDSDQPVLSKDILINSINNTFARLYLPNPVPTRKLPIIVYFHGGGFVLGSPSSTMFQTFVSGISQCLPAVVVSIGYRLAPEHRLPAAYDDCIEGLQWLKTTKDEWLTMHADVKNCFLMGTSAGGNIAWQVGIRATVKDFAPITFQGLILHQPFFGGVKRSASEIRLMNNATLPVNAADVMWELALPEGANRDHEWCNPMVGIELDHVLEKVKMWKVLVTGWEGDPLVDRQRELAKVLEEKLGVSSVVGEFNEGGFHGCELWEEDKAEMFFGVLKKFVLASL